MAYRKTIIFTFLGLLFVAFGFYLDKKAGLDPNILAAEIVNNLNEEIATVELEASSLLNNDATVWNSTRNSFFLMDSTAVLRWSKNNFLPDVRTVQGDFSILLLQWPRGKFLLRKWKIDDTRFLLAVITLQNRYKINNRYLVSGWNEAVFPTQEVTIVEAGGNGQPFVWNGKKVFNIQFLGESPQRHGINYIQYCTLFLGFILFAIGIFHLISQLHRKERFEASFISLLTIMIGGRLLVLNIFSGPNIDLFDPVYFASSSYNRSIGDLFINAICVAIPITYLFYNYYRFGVIRRIIYLRKSLRSIVSILFILLCFFSILLAFLFIETIFHNSAIPLDITRTLSFNTIRFFSYLSIVIGCVTSFMLVHIFARISLSVSRKGGLKYYFHLGIGVVTFLLFSYLIQRDYWITSLTGIFYLSLIQLLHLTKYLSRTSYTSFLYLFIAIFTFAIQGAFSIKRFVIEDKISTQFRFANSFLTDRDYLGEYLLGESVERISSDPFIQTRLGSPFLSKTAVRQKVKQVYLNSYFDRYGIKIHLFNSAGESYDNSTVLAFSELINSFQKEANKTNYEGVYFLKNASPESTKQYLVVIPINRFGVVTGYIVLDLSLKRIIPRNVFPELLLDDRFVQYFKNKDFSYAFYNGHQVSSSFGDFNYERNFSPSWLTNEQLYNSGIIENGTIHIGIEDESEGKTIVSSPSYTFFGVVTNFSFLFTIGLNLILAGLLFYGVGTLYQRKELNYSARIQLYVYVAFILPLFLVSATTLGLIGRSVETQLKQEYIEKSKLLGDRLTPLIDAYFTGSNKSLSDLDNQLIDLSKLANVDASIFLPSGKLLTSSQPLIYEDRILSSLINREAYEVIVTENEQSFVNNEQIGSLTYNSSYFALKSPDSGELIGILRLPFFESAYSLEKTQINVLANIMTIFCIVFILFLVLSFFAVRWLTFPLQFITKTLRSTTLTGSNKPLVWNSNDEIGLMVNEYNKMVENLEQSKVELSRIQKESAWREIAKQVAHEVKNPLTPMKLTLQQMEQALLNNELSKEKTEKSLQTLLRQVEILNDIAASFSAFARMPAPILQKIELTRLVKQVVDLHSDYKESKIILENTGQPIYILGDGQLLSRIFSNILLNAIQSGREGEVTTIQVKVDKAEDKCLITFSDDGLGIDPALREKVFMPHFSTKKSGSGLGLAIAKQGIEQNGGTIRFETDSNRGTIFTIELPIAK